jgi:hypothetical protein
MFAKSDRAVLVFVSFLFPEKTTPTLLPIGQNHEQAMRMVLMFIPSAA